MKTPESIHGHEVMRMVADARRAFSKTELVAEIGHRFGPYARFHACSADHMDASQLVDFLIARNKFGGDERALTLDPAVICQH